MTTATNPFGTNEHKLGSVAENSFGMKCVCMIFYCYRKSKLYQNFQYPVK
jgi:hypothetical protein